MIKPKLTTTQNLVCIVVLIISVAIFHWRGLRPGYTFLPVDLAQSLSPWRTEEVVPLQNPLISDPLYQYYPLLESSTLLIKAERQWLSWNPLLFAGHPVYADPLYQPYFPLIPLLGLVMNPVRAYGIGLWLLACVAGLSSYAWLRSAQFNPVPALAGALSYALGGYLVTWFETTFWLSSLALFPAVLLFFQLGIRHKKALFFCIGAICTALAFFGGQVQFTLMFLLFLALLSTALSVNGWRQGEPEWWLPVAGGAFISAIGFLLAGVFLMPFIEFVTLSHRVRTDIPLLNDPIAWQQLITFFIPDYFGNPTYSGYDNRYAVNYSEGTMYFSIVALFIGLRVIFHQKTVQTWLMLGLLALFFYFSIGGPGVAYLGYVPGLSFFSLHRTLFIMPLIFAWLIAAGMENIKGREGLFPTIIFFGAIVGISLFIGRADLNIFSFKILTGPLLFLSAAIVLYLGAYQQLGLKWAPPLIILFIFIDLFVWGSDYSPTGPVDAFMPITPGIAVLQESVDLSADRAMVLQRNDNILIGMGNSVNSYGVPVAGGNSSLVNREYLQLAVADDPQIDIFWAEKGNLLAFSYPSPRLLDLLGITYLVSSEPLPYPDIVTEFAQSDCETTIPLTEETNFQFSQAFVPTSSAFNRIDLKLINTGGQPAQLNLKIYEPADQPRLILDETRELSGTDEEQNLVYFFAPQADSIGKPLLWEVTSLTEELNSIELCANGAGEVSFAAYGSTWSNLYAEEMYIYQRLTPLPRAFVVADLDISPDPGSLVSSLLSPDFDPSSTGLVTPETGQSLENVSMNKSQSPSTSESEILSYRSNEVEIEATTDEAGILVIRDQFHPGWQATVNGEPAESFRINHYMRGVEIPAGTSIVQQTFRPASLTLGRYLTLAGLVLGAIAGFFLNRR